MNNFSVRNFVLPVLFILIVLGGVFFYFKTQKSTKTTPAADTATSLPAGVAQAQKEAKDYSSLIKKTSVQQSIQGVVKTVTETGLTVESNDQSLEILNEGGKTVYAKLPKDATSSSKPVTPAPIKADEIKIGDKVLVIRNLDSDTGSSTIVAVTVLP